MPERSAPKPLEQFLELRNHENQQDDGDDDRDAQHGNGIEERLFDLLLEGLGLFLVGRNFIEQGLERTGLLTRLDQVDEKIVEVQRKFRQRLGQRAAAFDVRFDVGAPVFAWRASRARCR